MFSNEKGVCLATHFDKGKGKCLKLILFLRSLKGEDTFGDHVA